LTDLVYVPESMMIGTDLGVTIATTGEGEVTALVAIGLRHRQGEVTTAIGHHAHHRRRHGISAPNAHPRGVATMIVRLQQSTSLSDLLTQTHEKGGRMSIGRTLTPITMNQPLKPIVAPKRRSSRSGSSISGSGALQARANVIKRQLHRLDKEKQT
jgi:hypothetical protein